MELEMKAIERKGEIILPATIREKWHGEMLIPEVAMVEKQEFNKVPKELVRCKNCKYHEVDMVCSHPSEWGNEETRNHRNPEFFCADGER